MPDRKFDGKTVHGSVEYKIVEYLKIHFTADLRTLCNRLHYSQTQIFRALKSIEDKIVKEPSPKDKRVTVYSLTEEGISTETSIYK